MDQASEEALAELEATIRGINAAAALVRTQRCRVDLARVLNCGAFGGARRAAEAAAAAATAEAAAERGCLPACAHGAAGAHTPGGVAHCDGFGACGSRRGHERGAHTADAEPSGHAHAAHPLDLTDSQQAYGRADADPDPESSTAANGHQGSSAAAAEGGSSSSGAQGVSALGSKQPGRGEAAPHRHDSGFATVSVRLGGDLCLERCGLYPADFQASRTLNATMTSSPESQPCLAQHYIRPVLGGSRLRTCLDARLCIGFCNTNVPL